MRSLSRILLGLTVASSSAISLFAAAGPANAETGGGCRKQPAYVAFGYYLTPCVGSSPDLNYVSDQVNFIAEPYSTDVYVCGQLMRLSGSAADPPHCTHVGPFDQAITSGSGAYGNDPCPPGGNYYKSWIRESNRNYGDVESPIVYC